MSEQILKACKELIDDEKRVAPTSFLTKHASKFCLEHATPFQTSNLNNLSYTLQRKSPLKFSYN
jgi:hypothetical protein